MTPLDPRIAEQFRLKAGFDLEPGLLMLCLVGSDSHGTKIEGANPHGIDDTDFMGVYVPPPTYTLGMRSGPKGTGKVKNADEDSEEDEREKRGMARRPGETVNFQYEELDCVFYSLRHFVQLLLQANPNVLGTLWLEPEHYLVSSPQWERLMAERRAFSSKKAYQAFTGYASGQAKKMESFDLATQLEWDRALRIIEAAGYTKEQIVSGAHREMPNRPAVLEVIAEEYRHGWPILVDSPEVAREVEAAIQSVVRIHARHMAGYMGEKRKRLVRKYGYDCKNGSHLIRLIRMCTEYLGADAGGGHGVEGEFRVFRTWDADELRAIKSGQWTLDQVKEEAARQEQLAEAALARSTLPERADIEAADRLLVELTRQTYGW